ncbi:MAG TPA: DUF222 domain-containing protein [Acidimicrobiales bacterium]|nr:DUF222 domain-containing protein [Acidimicrobiales bacterium]
MSITAIFDPSDDAVTFSTAELASELIHLSSRLAAMEARWLSLLAEYDRREGWRADAQLSCVDWLVWRCGLSRRTAHEKLRVAHELQRRPAVREGFSAGALSYSKVRAITRITGAGDETDEWLLKLAESGTTADLERVARRYEQLAEQEHGIDDYLRRYDRRCVRASRTYDGMMVIEKVLPIEEGEEYLALLEAVDECSAEHSSTGRRRADAAMALARAGRASLDKPGHVDRYTVHVVADLDALVAKVGRAELIDNTPVAMETLRRLACDCGIVRHLVKGASKPLDIGTRTSVWTTAQRRAIQVRDGGHCRFPGCHRKTCDCHHLVHAADGGPTAVSNGCLLCPRHHTCLHEGGFTISGEANETLTFLRSDGTVVGRTGGHQAIAQEVPR